MRIAIFTDTYLPDINGVVSSCEILRDKLEKEGHDVYVICTYKGFLDIKQEGKIIRLPGIEIKQLYGYSVTSPFHIQFANIFKKLNIDIIHAQTEFGVGILANIMASRFDIPLVRTYHTTYEDYTHYMNPLDISFLDAGLKRIVASVSRAYGDNCLRLISPSKKTKDLLIKYDVKTPIEIIPTGIELSKFKEEVDSKVISNIKEECGIKDEFMLLFVGRIAEEKSIDIIIRSFKTIKEKKLKIKFVIVGAGPQLEELKKYTSDLDLNDYVVFLGKKPFDQINTYYHAADAFISASTSETQGMTFIEALASGLMVLARYDEVLEDIVIPNENGYFFKDEEELSKVLENVASFSTEQRNKFSLKAASSTDKYSGEIFAQKMEKLYEEVIEEYRHNYQIIRTTLRDDTVTLRLLNPNKEEEKLVVSLDDYFANGFRSDTKMLPHQYEFLRKKENYTLAYKGCLRKLANRDYSIKKMREYLNLSYKDLSIEEKNSIIDKLITNNLLNDKVYATSKINSFKSMLYSSKKMKQKLKNDGVNEDIIEELVKDDLDSELSHAKHFATKYKKTVKNKSLNDKKQTILKKLINDGFSYEVSKEAIECLDFTEEAFEEKDLLKKQALKAFKHYEKKYKGTELRNHVYHSLESKGFTMENIYAVINEMEWK